METKRVMTETLEDLVDKELKQFIWQLSNGVKPGTAPIPRAKLQTSDREDVVDCMVKQYPDDAGEIAVQALRNMKQNELGQRLELKLKEVQQPVQEERRNDDESMELQPIQSDWYRPYSITACSQLFKHKLLTEEKNDVYLPTRTSHRKGSALLINNIKCDYITDRKGAEIDQANMEWLLTALGYSVEKHTNLSGNALNTAVKNFSKRYEHQNSDSTFVVIMSHGNTGGVYVPDSAFESDSWVHKEKDFVCFMSSLPDVSAYRDPENGSFFINYIVDTFSTSAHKYDIMELFRKIASRMEKDQRFRNKQKLLPCIERTTLVKKFYLFPGL
ncbi:caspase b-like isoform X2 [Garra rufa]|uniref:caspase b-like isoform X2 n=1 Tax=Garra rufa TaxID=137080 RepID=UPI003CCE6AA8